jgi:beta-lactamase superfamily II metal-dependent hydrolase
MLERLFESGVLTPNHLSIIARLVYGEFSMVFAADAQMENWNLFDEEGMLEAKCDVLRTAHHGSKRGSQWERMERLGPGLVVVSSDPGSGHHLPDAVGGVAFWEFDKGAGQAAALTNDTGTIMIEVPGPHGHARTISAFGEAAGDDVFPGNPTPLPATDWIGLVEGRLH